MLVEEVGGRLVSGGFFQVLGVRPAIGRLFTTDDDRDATSALVLSHGFWQRRFGGRPDVLGRLIVPGLSVGILLGALVIIASWLLTWFYVRWANAKYDTELERIRGAGS